MDNYPQSPQFIAEQLQGTASSLSSVLEQYGMEEAEDDTDFCHELDQEVFCCNDCGWWCEPSEMTNDEDQDWKCTDCAPDIEED